MGAFDDLINSVMLSSKEYFDFFNCDRAFKTSLSYSNSWCPGIANTDMFLQDSDYSFLHNWYSDLSLLVTSLHNKNRYSTVCYLSDLKEYFISCNSTLSDFIMSKGLFQGCSIQYSESPVENNTHFAIYAYNKVPNFPKQFKDYITFQVSLDAKIYETLENIDPEGNNLMLNGKWNEIDFESLKNRLKMLEQVNSIKDQSLEVQRKPSLFCGCTLREVIVIEQYLLQQVQKLNPVIEEKTEALFRSQTSRKDSIYLMQVAINNHLPIKYQGSPSSDPAIKTLNKFNKANDWSFGEQCENSSKPKLKNNNKLFTGTYHELYKKITGKNDKENEFNAFKEKLKRKLKNPVDGMELSANGNTRQTKITITNFSLKKIKKLSDC